MSRRACTPLDVALLAVLLLANGALFAVAYDGRRPRAVEFHSGRGTDTVPLGRDDVVEVAGPLGVSRIQVRSNAARFLSSPCPLQICVASGPVARVGQVVACLPNRVAIRLVGVAATREGVDAVGR